MDKKEAIIIRGREARTVLADPVFEDCAKDIMQETFIAWSATELEETETREGLYHDVRALQKLVVKLEAWEGSGKTEERNRDLDR